MYGMRHVIGLGTCLSNMERDRTSDWRAVGRSAEYHTAGRGSKVGCIHVQVLASGTWDAPPGLLLTCERTNSLGYLINCGEGTHKFCVEHKMRLVGKLQRILLTRLDWDAAGGLPDVLLTMGDHVDHKGSVALHGPAPLSTLVSSFRGFVHRRALPQWVSETPGDWPDAAPHSLEESGMTVTPILLSRNVGASANLTADTLTAAAAADAPAGDEAGGGAEVKVEPDVKLEPEPKRRKLETPDVIAASAIGDTAMLARMAATEMSDAAMADSPAMKLDIDGAIGSPPADGALFASRTGPAPSLCWLMEMPPVPPKFNAAEAERLGVPSGNLRAALCRGETVTLDDGTLVQPDDVLHGGADGELLLIADCPTLDHLEILASHPSLQPHVCDAPSRPLYAIIHLTPASVSSTREYVSWCASLPASTTHLFTQYTPQDQRFAFIASARMQLKLHGVHEGVFPKPQQQPMVKSEAPSSCLPAGLPASAIAADMLSKLVLRPTIRAGIDRTDEESLVRWQDSTGSYNTLAESELQYELTLTPRLRQILQSLPSSLLLPEGTWQYDLRGGVTNPPPPPRAPVPSPPPP